MQSKISAYIDEWALTTTIHAVPNIFRTQNTLVKTIWFISLLVSGGWCFFMVINTMAQFYDYEVVTQIKMIYEIPAVFPAVTVCNANSFTTQKSLEYVKRYLEILNFTDFENIDVSKLFQTDDVIRDPLEEMMFIMKQSVQRYIMYNTSDEEKRELGMPLDDLVISCYYNFINCDLNDFTWFYDKKYGNCYTFNSGLSSHGKRIALKSNLRGGSEAGLMMSLFTGMVDSIYTLATESGAHIFIHNQTIKPSYTEGIQILSGLKTSIQIARTFSTLAPWPFNECTDIFDHSPYYGTIKDTSYKYRQQDCFFFVYQRVLVAECGCYDLGHPKPYADAVGCLLVNQTLCMADVTIKVFSAGNLNELHRQCPLECSSSSIAFSMSFLDYPNKAMAEQYTQRDYMKNRFKKITNQTLDYKMIKDNTAYVNIFYEDLTYGYITEKPKTSSLDLIASIGGTLGLFMGCSLLSFIEILEVLLTVISYKLDSRSKKKEPVPAKKHPAPIEKPVTIHPLTK